MIVLQNGLERKKIIHVSCNYHNVTFLGKALLVQCNMMEDVEICIFKKLLPVQS